MCINTIHYSLLILYYTHPRARVISFTLLPCCHRTSVHPCPHHPTLFIFPSSKMSLLLQIIHCYFVFLPVPIPIPIPITAPGFVHALVVLIPWLIVVLISVLHFHFLSISGCVPIFGSSFTRK